MILVPRQVWDPDENPSLPDQLLSELGMTIRYFSRRSGESDAQDSWTKLINLRLRKDISIVDLDDSELLVARSLGRLRRKGEPNRAPALGPGESAVIAVAEARHWAAGLDEGPARAVLANRSPGVNVRAIRDVLRWAVGADLLDSATAQNINHEMRSKGYKGPEFFWLA
jgi:hypothetical protein